MHGSVLGFFAYGALQQREIQGKDVLEVGSLDVNGSVRPMVMARGPASYLGVDVMDGPGVDRVVDAADLLATFGPDAFDVVISTEMLEHAADWQAAVANMVAVLRPGGVLVWTTRSPGFAYHHPPDRWRYTQQAMQGIVSALGLEPIVLMDDPEYPGVFVKARKPTEGWATVSLRDMPGVTPMREPLKWLGLPANPDGCGYYRFWSPWTQLQRASGHHIVIPPPGQHEVIPDEDQVAEFDLVARQRPGGRQGVRAFQRWKGLAKLVFEADDDLFNPDPSGLPHWLDPDMQATVRQCMELADLVTTSTEVLAERFRHHSDNVAVIPNYVHKDLLALERPRRERVTICWEGGVTHLQDLVLVQQPLRDILFGLSPAPELHMVGTDYRPLFGHAGRFSPWEPNLWDFYRRLDGDIGIAPLYDTLFNRARTSIKVLTYAALGIPVVASDLEPYRDFVIDGVTGFLAHTEADWYGRLRDLVMDAAMREEMGQKAKEVARQHTIQEHWTRWSRAYEEVCS